MKKQILSILMIVFSLSLLAQIPEKTKEAARLYQDKEYTKAKALIDESVNNEGAENGYSWHVRGHIYKELYKQVDQFDRQSSSRVEAVESFRYSLKYDADNEYSEWNRTSLKYLASTFWNDAVNLIENSDPEVLHHAEESYESYKATIAIINEDTDPNKVAVDFYKAYATANRKIIEKKRNMGENPENYARELDRIRMCYEKALGLAPEDYGSNYNFAINLYNEAAYRIERIPADADLTILILRQEGCVELFKTALPYALKAYEQKPGRIEILKALRAIYLSLSEYALFEKYDLLIKEKQGEIGTPTKHDLNLLRKQGRLDH